MEHYGNRRQRVEKLVSAWTHGPGSVAEHLSEPDDPLIEVAVEPRRRARTQLADEEVDAMRTARAEGVSVATLARRFGVHHGTVWAKTRPGLLGDVVLQFEGEHRQAVYERHEIDGVAPVAGTVVDLTCDYEAVRVEQFCGFRVAIGGGRVVQIDVLAEVAHPAPQQVDHAALGDLTLQPGEELVPRRRRLTEAKTTPQAAAGSPR